MSEDIPAGILTDDAILQIPPEPVSAIDLLPETLPEAWGAENTTALAITTALSKKAGKTLPWGTMREAIGGALKARFLELCGDSGPWPADFSGAPIVKLRLPKEKPPQPQPIPKPGILVAEAYLGPSQIQDLADQIPEITKTAAGLDLKYHVRMELKGDGEKTKEIVKQINESLKEVSDELEFED